MKQYGFGVDIGGTTCKIGLFDTGGGLLEKWEIPTNKADHGAGILTDVAAAIEERLTAAGIDKEMVQGVGLGVPGPVTADGTVMKCVNLGWGILNAGQILQERLQLPVKVGNDANVAALGEMWQGGGKGYQDVVMITLGTGVGGGIIIGGKIASGAHGAGGEIGHIKVCYHETEHCGCGKTGCLEQYASATGIVRMAKKRIQAEETTLNGFSKLSAKLIFDEAKKGDRIAGDLIGQLGQTLGTALANLACVADPEVFVIGGGVSKAGEVLLDAIKKSFREHTFHACEETVFALAELGNDAGIYGGVQMILEPGLGGGKECL